MAVQAAPTLVVLDEPNGEQDKTAVVVPAAPEPVVLDDEFHGENDERFEVKGVLKVRLTSQGQFKVKVMWATLEKTWIELHDLDEGPLKEEASRMIEDIYGC